MLPQILVQEICPLGGTHLLRLSLEFTQFLPLALSSKHSTLFWSETFFFSFFSGRFLFSREYLLYRTVRGLNEMMPVKFLEYFLAHSKRKCQVLMFNINIPSFYLTKKFFYLCHFLAFLLSVLISVGCPLFVPPAIKEYHRLDCLTFTPPSSEG